MSIDTNNSIPAEVMAELEDASFLAEKGKRDPEAARRACEEMDLLREEIRKKHGVLDIGVPAIRELRNA